MMASGQSWKSYGPLGYWESPKGRGRFCPIYRAHLDILASLRWIPEE